MNCPWCGAKPKRWDAKARRGEWLCGSIKHGREPYQFDKCRINELEAEVDRLEQQRDEAVKGLQEIRDGCAEWARGLWWAAIAVETLARVEGEQK